MCSLLDSRRKASWTGGDRGLAGHHRTRSWHTDLGVSVWPFQGELDELLWTSRCVIVETYPAEACLRLGLTPPGRGWSKQRQADRRCQGKLLLTWAYRRRVKISERLAGAIRDGFTAEDSGEDPFDAVLGLMSMTEVLLGHRAHGAPAEPAVRAIEGWIFGQAPCLGAG